MKKPIALKPGVWWALVSAPDALPRLCCSRSQGRAYRWNSESQPIKVIVRMAPTTPAWKRNRARVQRQALRDLGGVKK